MTRTWPAPRWRTGCASRRGAVPLAVVAAVRPGAGSRCRPPRSSTSDVLGRDAAAELVGPARADELYERSKGHPLFLTELAQQAAGGRCPRRWSSRCPRAATSWAAAGALLRTAAVIGPELDIDLLAAVLGRGVVELLDDAERAVAGQFLADESGTLRFRHELLRETLAASATAGRAALLHRQAGRVLARRPDADPATVAHHARLGGDLTLASSALRDASARAGERFDHAAAEALLDDALVLHPDQEGWLARARVRTRRGRYPEALEDVQRAGTAGPAALEVGAWASYFGRRFGQAAQFAEDGALAAVDPATRARCLAVGGRTHHAAGDLARAERLLGEAFSLAEGADRVTAAAWLGVLRAHQSRAAEALSLLRPAARGHIGAEHTSAMLHALLFTGHAHALAGRPALALAAFARHTEEVGRRQVPRFAGRAVNFAGWVLRNLGADREAADQHAAALEIAQRQGTAEVTIAALEDLAEQCLDQGDPDGAQARLAEAAALLQGDLVFGWRLDLKHQLVTGRLALLCGDPGRAAGVAAELESQAAALGVPRYLSVARLLRHRADRALGQAGGPGRGRGRPGPARQLGRGGGVAVDRRGGRRVRQSRLAGPGRRPGRTAGPARGGVRGRAPAARGPAAGWLARPGRLSHPGRARRQPGTGRRRAAHRAVRTTMETTSGPVPAAASSAARRAAARRAGSSDRRNGA